jgi:pimeloyl-ACP methyl ester carboxylesterase
MTTPSFHPFRSEQAKAEFENFYLEKSKAWPVPSETRFIDTAAGRTFMRVSGSPTDPPLVLLPGVRGTTLMWMGMISALSAHYRTYAVDTITDIGLSILRGKMSTPDDLARWLDEVFTVLSPEVPLNLVGMSYGGWLAALYSLRFPHRVRRVVLLAPGGTVLRFSPGFFVRVMLVSLPIPGLAGKPMQRTLRWIFRDTVQSGERGRVWVEREIAEQLSAGRFFDLPRLIWPTVFGDDEWRRFTVPGLFMVGENEKIYSPRAAVKRLNRVAPQIGTEIIPGAGHDLTMVQADLVAGRVIAFLGASAARSVAS